MNKVTGQLARWIWLPIVVLIAGLAQIGYWAMQRDPPIIYIGNPVVESSDDDIIRLSFDVRRLRSCDAELTRWLFDADHFRFDFHDRNWTAEEINQLQRLNRDKVRVILPIPKGARRGTMIYGIRILYFCEPLSRYIWPIEVSYDVPFFIPPDED